MAPAEQLCWPSHRLRDIQSWQGLSRHVLHCIPPCAAETRESWLQARLSLSPAASTRSALATISLADTVHGAAFAHSPLKRIGHRVLTENQWNAAKQIVLNTLDQWYREQPNQRGFAANQLTPKLPARFTLLKELPVEMINAKLIRLDGAKISLAGHTAALPGAARA